jgi:FAD synthase
MHDHERYSSTAVRKALSEGDMDRVTRCWAAPTASAVPW